VAHTLSDKHCLIKICKALGLSRSGYYSWRLGKPGKREEQDVVLRQELLRAHTNTPTYGADNLHADVRERYVCGRNRIRRLMKELDIKSKRRRRYRATTNSKHDYSVAPNLLKGLKVERPNQVWVSDITYIPTDEGWLYLAIVKDLFTKEIVGHSCSTRIDSELTINALKQAIRRCRPQKGLIHHSDRGIQYCSKDYSKLLTEHGITPSMSRKGNPYDNAAAENFFSCIKCEMIHLSRFATHKDAILAVFRYIEGFYNRRRRHEALGRISPSVFRTRWERAHGSVGKSGSSGSGEQSQGILPALTLSDRTANDTACNGAKARYKRASMLPEVSHAAMELVSSPGIST